MDDKGKAATAANMGNDPAFPYNGPEAAIVGELHCKVNMILCFINVFQDNAAAFTQVK